MNAGIAQDDGKVRVGRGQLELDGAVAVLGHLGNLPQIGFGRRLRILRQMAIERIDHVVGVERLAAVEGHALAQLEGPFCRVIVGFPTGRQPWHGAQIRTAIDHQVINRKAAQNVGRRIELGGIERIDVLGRLDADRDSAAFLRLLRLGGRRDQARQNRGADTGGGHTPGKLAPRNAPLDEQFGEIIGFQHECLPFVSRSPFTGRISPKIKTVITHFKRLLAVCKAALCRLHPGA